MSTNRETNRPSIRSIVATLCLVAALCCIAPAAAAAGPATDSDPTVGPAAWLSWSLDLPALWGWLGESVGSMWDGIRETVDPNGQAATSTTPESPALESGDALRPAVSRPVR